MIEYYKNALSEQEIIYLEKNVHEFYNHDTEIFHSLRADLIKIPLFFKFLIYEKLQAFSEKYKVEVGEIEFTRYRRYLPGDYIKPHNDNYKNGNRKVTIIFGINDQYSGGELCINNTEFKILRGDMLLFSSEIMHEVKTVTDGVRDIIVVLTHTLENI
jgi:Rps23 Pro-64 3,4-dihydroxylase Tpa1-like proline 4-hydroxylase